MSKSATHNAIMEVGGKDRAPMLVVEIYMMDHPAKEATEISAAQLARRGLKIHSSVSPEKQKLIDVDAEAVHIIFNRMYNDIYSIVDDFANAKEMWLAIEGLMQGKEIIRPPSPPLELEHEVVSDKEDTQRVKEIAKFMALISTSFKKIYKATNNNLRTSSNTRNKIVDNTPKTYGYTRQTGQYENQRDVNVFGNKDTVGNQIVQLGFSVIIAKGLGIQQGNADSDEEPTDQEQEAHYLYMAKIQEVIPAADESTGPVFNKEPLEHVHTSDKYNVFSMENDVTIDNFGSTLI
ncbi:hypothetical protein Tco_0217024 [Tanacetum coccineum]